MLFFIVNSYLKLGNEGWSLYYIFEVTNNTSNENTSNDLIFPGIPEDWLITVTSNVGSVMNIFSSITGNYNGTLTLTSPSPDFITIVSNGTPESSWASYIISITHV